MTEHAKNRLFAALMVSIGACLLVLGIAVGHADDVPGAGLIGILAFVVFTFFAWRTVRLDRPSR